MRFSKGLIGCLAAIAMLFLLPMVAIAGDQQTKTTTVTATNCACKDCTCKPCTCEVKAKTVATKTVTETKSACNGTCTVTKQQATTVTKERTVSNRKERRFLFSRSRSCSCG
jgi:hypothetical protein